MAEYSPINYNLDVQTPFQAALQGYQAGAAMRDDQYKAAQEQYALTQQRAMATDLRNLSLNPNATGTDYAAMVTRYPQLSEQLTKASNLLTETQKQNALKTAIPVYSAASSGRTDIAADILRRQAEAKRNSGDERGALHDESIATMLVDHPDVGRNTLGLGLAAIMGPDKFAATLGSIGEEQRKQQAFPLEQRTKAADATLKEAEAGVAPEKAVLGLAKTREEIQASQSQQRIAELDTQIKQANSETERGKLQLERDKLQAELDKKNQASGTDAQNQMDSTTQALATVNSLLKNPVLGETFGVGSTIGKILGNVPGTDNKDFRAQLETLKSQQFLTAIQQMKGMGALSDAEGGRLERAVAALDPDQSPGAFRNQLNIVRSSLEKAQQKLIAGGKLPTTGGAFVMKHPVYGNITDANINELMTKFPGATRDQVMEYLRQSGGSAPANSNTGGATGSY